MSLDAAAVASDHDPFAGGALARVVPTTEAQREIWLADRLGRDTSLAYNESVSLHFEGALDLAALADALDALVARHEALRTTFGDDGLEMLVADAGTLPAALADLSALDDDARADAVAAALAEAVETPFDLAAGLLVRARLLRLAADRHRLVLTAHHIVCDGWSFGVLARDLMQAYRHRRSAGIAAEPLPPAATLGDFALAEGSPEATRRAEDDERWWLEYLRAPLPVLDLPVDHGRSSPRRFDSRRIDLPVPASLAASLRGAAGRAGVTLFSLLCGTFAAWIARLAGAAELIVGVPSAAQAGTEFETMVGHAVNMLPMRFEIDLEAPAREFLARVQSTVLDAQDHLAATFGALLKKLQIPRDPARPTLVSVVFNLDDPLPADALAAGDLKVSLSSNPRRYENFELFLNVTPEGAAVRLECQYSTTLFDEATVRRWLDLYVRALERCAADAGQPMADLLAPAEADLALLERFNATALPLELGVRIETLIERQAAATPDAVAIAAGGRRMTYRELDRRADELAMALRESGVAPCDLVGLSCGRSEQMVVGLLGILKSGAGYVPLDPAFPAERLAFMAEDAGLGFVVVDAATREPWAFGDAEPVDLDVLSASAATGADAAKATRTADPIDPPVASQAGETGNGYAARALHAAKPPDAAKAPRAASAAERTKAAPAVGATAPPAAGTADDVAYVIYTSGSTGRPKGVRVPHRSVVNLLESLRTVPGIRAGHRMLAVTTLSFDIAVSEVVMPLTVGACIVVADHAEATDGDRLRALVEREAVDCIDATPATWRLLLAAGWPGRRDLLAICTGEPLPPDLGRALLPRVGELWNGYGPTETTVWSSFHRVESIDGPVAIGRPVANTRFHVLDAALRPLPVGAVGELCIAGDGVTLGYLDRPELTAERFVRDPLSDDAQAKLYRTGDLGRWRSDGVLECLGRIDNQVKLRGYRIELGEIESVLARQAGVSRAVVVTREDAPGDVRIVAYVVPSGAMPEPAALRDALAKSLPDYMLPQRFVQIAAVPLLPNGKLDRRGLPAPAGAATAAGRGVRTPPRDDGERRVLEAMEAVLHLPGLGVDDHFFALGGHSLLAAHLANALGRITGRPVPMRAVFDAPTAARLARWLAERDGAATGAAADAPDAASPAIEAADDQRRAPASSMQQRVWFVEQLHPGQTTFNTPMALRLLGPLDALALEAAFDALVRRQSTMRTAIVDEGGVPVQRIEPSAPYRLGPALDLSPLPDVERERTLAGELRARIAEPIDLGQAPLFRAALFRLGDAEHLLFFMPHHIVWDGWSFDLFVEEMAALYEAFSKGEAPALPPLRFSYGDFARWQQRWLESDDLKRQVAHWSGVLADLPEPLDLPVDRPFPPRMSHRGATEWLAVDPALATSLRELGRAHDATLFMTLLAAYAALLSRLTGQTDLVVGTPVRGRHGDAVEKLMGFFVNALPLRLKIDPDRPFADLIAQVRQVVLDAFSHPDVPFDHLVRELKAERHEHRPAIYQTFFSFQDGRARPTHWGDLQLRQELLFQPGTAEDLGLWFLEKADGLSGGLTYNTDVFDDVTAQRLAARFRRLLASAAAAPRCDVARLALLPADEAATLGQWNATGVEDPPAANAAALIAASFERSRGRPALRSDGWTFGYDEIETRVNRLARTLRSLGAGRGALVGLCLERSVDLLVAQLAILRSGAAYVPLDPGYPAERLAFMAEDAGLSLLLTHSSVAGTLEWPRERALWIDADASAIASQPASPPAADEALDARPEDPAYVIYTSGSSGQPKGVAVPHRAVVNFLRSMVRAPGLDATDRLLAVTTLSFDIAVLELLGPLSVGAEIVLASRDAAMDGEALLSLLHASDATVMQATPTTWRLLIGAGWFGHPRFKALVGGESLPPDLAAQLLERCGALWNMYGPTETTVWSTCWRVEQPELGIFVGRPIANTQVHVLDERLEPCPIGVPGEICIGGAGVALGYWKKEALTSERFVDDPFAVGEAEAGIKTGTAGAKLYRTGDRGRWRHEGVIEHLGRLDAQVKVRGHRIEPGEIEAVLGSHAGVAACIVVVREDRPGDVRLVAYFVPQGEAPEADALRSHLRSRLPEFMLPQHLVPLERLPLLPNGKIDRRKLPAPAEAPEAARSADAGAAALSPTEAAIADIWQRLLEIGDVRAADNFFNLGGYSLLAMRAASEMSTALGARIHVRRLIFESLAQLARTEPDETAGEAPRAANDGGTGFFGRLLRAMKPGAAGRAR